MDMLREFIVAHPILAASLSSLWGAVVIDLVSFTKSKDPGSFFMQFKPTVALWKYAQAFIGGFLGNVVVAAGAGAVVGLVVWGL